MWFKNLIVYRLTQPWALSAEALEEKLQERAFTPCGAQQASTFGWTPPMGSLSTQLVHAGHGRLMICAKTEEKILPPAVVKRHTDEKVAEIEKAQDRKVRKKERDAIKDNVLVELLPKAFTRELLTFAYIDPILGLLVVDASSAASADALTSWLRQTLGSLPIAIPSLNRSPASVMTAWLGENEPMPVAFEIGEEGELKDPTEDGAKARLSSQEMRAAEIAAHLESGKQAVRLGLEWKEQVGFVLGEDLIIRKLKFSDRLQEKAAEMGEADAAAAFDADFYLMTAALAALIPDLFDALGGEDTAAYSAGAHLPADAVQQSAVTLTISSPGAEPLVLAQEVDGA